MSRRSSHLAAMATKNERKKENEGIAKDIDRDGAATDWARKKRHRSRSEWVLTFSRVPNNINLNDVTLSTQRDDCYSFIRFSTLRYMRNLSAWFSWSILPMQNTTTPLRTTSMCVMMHSQPGQMFQMISLSLLFFFLSFFDDEQMFCWLFPVCTHRIYSIFFRVLTVLSDDVVLIGLGVVQNWFSNHTFYGNSHLGRVFFCISRHFKKSLNLTSCRFGFETKNLYNGIKHLRKMLRVGFSTFSLVFVILYCFCL